MEERIALQHNEENAATGGIFRVRASDADGASRSRILKIACPPVPGAADSPWQTSAAPDHFNYWRREIEAYESGFANSAYADAGIRAPRLLSADPQADGSVELWLEDVEGPSAFGWPVERLGRFGYELGAGQGSWAGRVPPPEELPWLSRRWLAQYLSHRPDSRINIDEAEWESPAVRAWSEPTRRALRRLWQSGERLLAAAEALPRTLCHLDLWPANLIEDGAGTSVLIDWAFVGEGAIGEDPANLLVDSVTDGLMDIALLPDLVEAVTEGYIKGLADGGWAGSADETRAAIAVCASAKWGWLGAAVVAATARGHTGRSAYGQDDSAAEALERMTPLADQLAQWADEALD